MTRALPVPFPLTLGLQADAPRAALSFAAQIDSGMG